QRRGSRRSGGPIDRYRKGCGQARALDRPARDLGAADRGPAAGGDDYRCCRACARIRSAMNTFHILIPARLGATRLPRKPLAELAGRALILRVCDRARAAGAASVHVATDSEAVADCVRADGGEVLMTRSDHRSGTDRLAEAAAMLGLEEDAIVVNLQGDEPEMPAACLRQVAKLLA